MNVTYWLLGMLVWLSSPAIATAQPLLYERFEDATAGTVRGQISFVEQVVGYGGIAVPNRCSAAFDGQGETCIDFGRETRVTSEDFTIEGFIQLKRRTGYAAIAADWNENGDQRCWALVVTPRGGLRFDVSPDGEFHPGNKLESTPRLIAPDRWYHVAAVSQGRISRLFVNGRQVAETNREQPGLFQRDQANLKIGNVDCYATDGPRPFCGWLDEVRITQSALTPDEFLQTREPLPEVRGPVPNEYGLPFVAADAKAAIQWQQQARTRLLQLVAQQQPQQPLQQLPLDFRLDGEEKRNGYTRYEASFQGNDDQTRYPCYFTVPDGEGPFPAMLAIHGHGGSREAVFDPATVYHAFADRLAQGGYVVIAPSFPHRDFCAVMLWDLMRLVDILESRSEVDPERIGAAGLSMGGEWTMWISACDPRIKAAVVSGWMCTTAGVFSVPNCACWELPGLVELMDVCEVHLLIAPRPVLFESAERDSCFPIQHTRDGFRRIQAGYRLFGAEDKVRQDTWPAGHEWHGEKAYPFLDKMLGGCAAEAMVKP